MPTKCGKKDSKGTYCQWGSHGAHYYYTPGDKASMEKARKKAAMTIPVFPRYLRRGISKKINDAPKIAGSSLDA